MKSIALTLVLVLVGCGNDDPDIVGTNPLGAPCCSSITTMNGYDA